MYTALFVIYLILSFAISVWKLGVLKSISRNKKGKVTVFIVPIYIVGFVLSPITLFI